MDDDIKLMEFLRKLIEWATNKAVEDGEDPAAYDLGFPIYQQSGVHHKGDVCRDKSSDQPFECLVDYDGSIHQDWNLSIPTIWRPFHGKDRAHAYPWAAPSGAHDQYKSEEFMTFTDGVIYECLEDTAFSPVENPSAWKKHE